MRAKKGMTLTVNHRFSFSKTRITLILPACFPIRRARPTFITKWSSPLPSNPAVGYAILSIYFEQAAGDTILIGTPAGVGAINTGDVMIASFGGLGQLMVKVV